MADQRHVPLLEKRSPEADRKVILRGRISPCNGCMNQVPVTYDRTARRQGDKAWPCPKAVLYAQKQAGKARGAKNYNFDSPIYDEKLKGQNPVRAGVGDHENAYAYMFIATYEDNVENGWNPKWDTKKIRCRGPFQIATPERLLNDLGWPDQGDHVLAFAQYYYLDGVRFEGLALEAATWQTHTSSTREIDGNLVSTTSGKL